MKMWSVIRVGAFVQRYKPHRNGYPKGDTWFCDSEAQALQFEADIKAGNEPRPPDKTYPPKDEQIAASTKTDEEFLATLNEMAAPPPWDDREFQQQICRDIAVLSYVLAEKMPEQSNAERALELCAATLGFLEGEFYSLQHFLEETQGWEIDFDAIMKIIMSTETD